MKVKIASRQVGVLGWDLPHLLCTRIDIMLSRIGRDMSKLTVTYGGAFACVCRSNSCLSSFLSTAGWSLARRRTRTPMARRPSRVCLSPIASAWLASLPVIAVASCLLKEDPSGIIDSIIDVWNGNSRRARPISYIEKLL